MTEMNISELITKSRELRDEAAALESQAKGLKAERKEIDIQIMELMREMGVDRTGNGVANVTITSKRLPKVTEWENFYKYIHDNEAYYLLQRRVSQKAVEEAAEDQPSGILPGIEFFEEESLSLRKV